MHAPPTGCNGLTTVIVVPVSTFVLTIVVSISLAAVTIVSVTVMSVAIISVPVPSAAIVIKVATTVITIVTSLIAITVFISVSIVVAIPVVILPSPTIVGLRRRQCGTASHQCRSNEHYSQPIHKSSLSAKTFSSFPTSSGLDSFCTMRTHPRRVCRFSLDKFRKDVKRPGKCPKWNSDNEFLISEYPRESAVRLLGQPRKTQWPGVRTPGHRYE